jgi:hypothetical protein
LTDRQVTRPRRRNLSPPLPLPISETLGPQRLIPRGFAEEATADQQTFSQPVYHNNDNITGTPVNNPHAAFLPLWHNGIVIKLSQTKWKIEIFTLCAIGSMRQVVCTPDV